MKSKTYWFYHIDDAEFLWMRLMKAGYTKHERLKVKFNWRQFRSMYRFKVYLPSK